MMKNAVIGCLLGVGVFISPAAESRVDTTNRVALGTNLPAAREAFHNLTPEQRRAKIQELRQLHGVPTNTPYTLTVEERRARFKKKVEELQRKKADGTLTPLERRQLELMQPPTNRVPPSLRSLAGSNTVAVPTPAGTTNFHLLPR